MVITLTVIFTPMACRPAYKNQLWLFAHKHTHTHTHTQKVRHPCSSLCFMHIYHNFLDSALCVFIITCWSLLYAH